MDCRQHSVSSVLFQPEWVLTSLLFIFAPQSHCGHNTAWIQWSNCHKHSVEPEGHLLFTVALKCKTQHVENTTVNKSLKKSTNRKAEWHELYRKRLTSIGSRKYCWLDDGEVLPPAGEFDNMTIFCSSGEVNVVVFNGLLCFPTCQCASGCVFGIIQFIVFVVCALQGHQNFILSDNMPGG